MCSREETKSSRNPPCCEGYMCTESNETEIDFESRSEVCKLYKAKEVPIEGRQYDKRYAQWLPFWIMVFSYITFLVNTT